ncbi:hypothetical protein NP233_g2363 [Leucocoprinus birnbaumii]|uniref:Uncharacterized protein n=1 Tax=Leucocoprinus birnbaumii TaxID=56174 RepID=A0AAD5W0W6_9AGAR|nr:hypothetical protein NP233_g2363 [Leucocoprinus birnbaumii]
MVELPSNEVLRHLVDVHCHPTDAPQISPDSMERLRITVCAMAYREANQILVRGLATTYPTKVVPSFESITPEIQAAFDRLLPLLPPPRSLSEIVVEIRQNLISIPHAMVGEVGLDESFHIFYNYDADPREPTPFTVPLEHQLSIIEAQIDLAVELGRNEKHSNIFLSPSLTHNGKSEKSRELIAACSANRILVETDHNDIDSCTQRTWDMVKIIAEIKGWDIEADWEETLDQRSPGVVHILEGNWRRFQGGDSIFASS